MFAFLCQATACAKGVTECAPGVCGASAFCGAVGLLNAALGNARRWRKIRGSSSKPTVSLQCSGVPLAVLA